MDEYSDSRTLKIQKSFRKNEKKYLNKLDEDAKVELMKRRFASAKKADRLTVWEKIKAFIYKILFTRIA
jgi:hypothetical protein